MSNFKQRALAVAIFAAGALAGGRSAHATTMVSLGPDDLAHIADAIVVGDVESVSTHTENHGLVLTHNTVKVREVLKGSVSVGDSLDVVEPGGVVGDRAMVVDGTAGYYAGEQVLLFLSQRPNAGGWLTVGWEQGKYTVLHGNGGPLRLTRVQVPMLQRGRTFAEAKIPAEAFSQAVSLDTFKSNVKSIVAEDARLGIRGADLPQYRGIGR